MFKLLQLFSLVRCLWELEEMKPKMKGIPWLRDKTDKLISGLVMFAILTVGICMGWIRIPTVLSDGYDYDNFNHC